MGKLKKIGIGFGVIIGSFFVLIIISQVWMASLTPEERQQLEEKRAAEALQKENDEKQEREARELQEKLDEEQERKTRELLELSKKKQDEREEAKLIEEQRLKALQKQKEKAKLDTEEKVLDFIYNYKGKDGTGLTLNNMISMIIEFSYPGEDILSSPSTRVSLTANPDFSKEDYRRYWKVEGELETYREIAYFGWIVDVETKSVYPMDEVAKSILDALDADN